MGAVVTVQNFEVGKAPTYTITFPNSGRRPAKIKLSAGYARPYDKFPDDPEYKFDTTPSISIVVPGQPIITTWSGKGALSDNEMTAFKSGTPTFYVYGKIDYTDVGGDGLYWTHVCVRYMPSITSVNNGFLNCNEYGDAK